MGEVCLETKVPTDRLVALKARPLGLEFKGR